MVAAVVLLLVLPVVWMMQAFSRTTSRQQERPGVRGKTFLPCMEPLCTVGITRVPSAF